MDAPWSTVTWGHVWKHEKSDEWNLQIVWHISQKVLTHIWLFHQSLMTSSVGEMQSNQWKFYKSRELVQKMQKFFPIIAGSESRVDIIAKWSFGHSQDIKFTRNYPNFESVNHAIINSREYRITEVIFQNFCSAFYISCHLLSTWLNVTLYMTMISPTVDCHKYVYSINTIDLTWTHIK